MKMPRPIAILAGFFLLWVAIAGCAQDEQAARERDVPPDLNSGILIDVRTPREFAAGHLDGAVNLSHEKIHRGIEAIAPDRTQKIVLYCRSGRRSRIAKKVLEEMGYEKVVNAGAYEKLRGKRSTPRNNPAGRDQGGQP